MNKKLLDLMLKIKNGDIISSINCDEIDIDELLDKRDEDPFDSDWVLANEKMELELANQNLGQATLDFIEQIREESFKAANKNLANGEIAEYVSDDFELIAKSIVIISSDPWVASLLGTYLNGEFPIGLLKNQTVPISDLV
ncbi:hypothetical protein [Marinomonas sp. 2405UD68-3]|uniref:hypothetical protein n=1 Tax=Marinomonas sp. 2405UD68-3 TaxID=3391835 RepID=UPI0039C91743